jgi:hypothetical protein
MTVALNSTTSLLDFFALTFLWHNQLILQTDICECAVRHYPVITTARRRN